MKQKKNQANGSLKGKIGVYIPEKRMWVYANTQKEADDYILRLRAKESALQASRQMANKKIKK